MLPAIPSLSALQAFAALAETGSLSAAGEQLGLTAGAISHHVRALEQQLGCVLLARTGRQARLTLAGRRYALRVRHALADVAAATAELTPHDTPDALTVSAPQDFVALWLLPRLPSFARLQPALRLQFVPELPAGDPLAPGVDCSLHFGPGPGPAAGGEGRRLMGDSQLLVAAPGFNRGALPCSAVEALACPLLDVGEPWSPWLSAAGVQDQRPAPHMRFSDPSHGVLAACQGLGLALTRRSLVHGHLLRGELQRITGVEVLHPEAYHLSWPRRPGLSPKVLAFAAWLQDEVGCYRASLASHPHTAGHLAATVRRSMTSTPPLPSGLQLRV